MLASRRWTTIRRTSSCVLRQKPGDKWTTTGTNSAVVVVSRALQLSSSAASSAGVDSAKLKPQYDAIVVGAGHNGLVAAAYLQKAGLDVCVLERRHVIGGAAVTEEIFPGFKFSRASYVLSLLRPKVLNDLELKKHGLKIIPRDTVAFTPVLSPATGKGPMSLTLGRDSTENARQIAQFSQKDAQAYGEYGDHMSRMMKAIDPLLDTSPVHTTSWTGPSKSLRRAWRNRGSLKVLLSSGRKLGRDVMSFYELLTAPAAKILNRWFESEPLKATLATDSVIGAMMSPFSPGSGYVLIHHVMGDIDGLAGIWAYVEGGMGAVSQSIANSAMSHGAHVFTSKSVERILVNKEKVVEGVLLKDGTEIRSKLVLSNATAKVTFIDLVNKGDLPEEFCREISAIDYTSSVTKINVAVKELPNFIASPNTSANKPMRHHCGSIHLNVESMDMIHNAYLDASHGNYSAQPFIEMTIPSSLDSTVAPPGCHVIQLFTQYTPYHLSNNRQWTDEHRYKYADIVFETIERHAPGFKSSVIGRDVLTPPDLERVFGLTGGNIFHGAMSLDQLYFCRPINASSDYRCPITGLYLCGSGAHPGGGVMGAPGRLAALTVLNDRKQK